MISVDKIPGIALISKSHRAHEYVLDFVVAATSVGKYLSAYHGHPVTTFAPDIPAGKHQTFTLQGQASGKTIEFLPHEVLKEVFVAEARLVAIPYLCVPSFPLIKGASTGAVAETFEGFAQAMFTRYWENNLSEIEKVHGKRKTGGWPQVLQFAAIVRDAMSHGGTIHMFPTIAPASHFGLKNSQSENGKKIIHTDLSCADIFLLLLDVDAAF
jgi:hypothetical protein